MSNERHPSTRTPTHHDIPPAVRTTTIVPPEPAYFDAQDTWEIAFLLSLVGSAREPFLPEKGGLAYVCERAELVANDALEHITRHRRGIQVLQSQRPGTKK